MTQVGDALDELPRANPGQLRRLDAAVDQRCQRIEPQALRRDGGGLRRTIRLGRRTELLDLALHVGEPRPQRLRDLRALEHQALDLAPQAAELVVAVLVGRDALFHLVHALDELLDRLVLLEHRRRRRWRRRSCRLGGRCCSLTGGRWLRCSGWCCGRWLLRGWLHLLRRRGRRGRRLRHDGRHPCHQGHYDAHEASNEPTHHPTTSCLLIRATPVINQPTAAHQSQRS